MKTNKLSFSIVAVLALLAFNSSSFAHEGHKKSNASEMRQEGELVKVTDQTDSAWLQHARAEYPLNSCVVSGDEFDGGPMGQPIDFIYQQPGQKDRLVRFCCKDCERDFRKDPAKYLGKIDEAKESASHSH